MLTKTSVKVTSFQFFCEVWKWWGKVSGMEVLRKVETWFSVGSELGESIQSTVFLVVVAKRCVVVGMRSSPSSSSSARSTTATPPPPPRPRPRKFPLPRPTGLPRPSPRPRPRPPLAPRPRPRTAPPSFCSSESSVPDCDESPDAPLDVPSPRSSSSKSSSSSEERTSTSEPSSERSSNSPSLSGISSTGTPAASMASIPARTARGSIVKVTITCKEAREEERLTSKVENSNFLYGDLGRSFAFQAEGLPGNGFCAIWVSLAPV